MFSGNRPGGRSVGSSRYSADHRAEIGAFAQDAATLVRNGFWLDPDASEAVSRAANAAVR